MENDQISNNNQTKVKLFSYNGAETGETWIFKNQIAIYSNQSEHYIMSMDAPECPPIRIQLQNSEVFTKATLKSLSLTKGFLRPTFENENTNIEHDFVIPKHMKTESKSDKLAIFSILYSFNCIDEYVEPYENAVINSSLLNSGSFQPLGSYAVSKEILNLH